MTSKKVSEIYQKMEHAEHIYKKPDTYTGSCENEQYINYILQSNTDGKHSIIQKTITWTPAFYKCFDELLVNAYDHKKRMDKVMETAKDGHYPVSLIRITINDDQSISFYNDGDGIQIEYMEEHKMYPPELIFGSLLTSTNYDDNEQREWGGRNGYGAKLANIFSKRFEVETVCHVNQKKFKQEFTDNMANRTKPKITSNTSKPYTRITWLPDYKRFNMPNELTDNIKALIARRVYDIAGVTDKSTKVFFNDKLVEIKTFDKYVELYLPPDTKPICEEVEGWFIAATSSSDDAFEQVSFVNGIHTVRGGTHVEYVADQIKTKLVDFIKKKRKVDIKPQIIKNQLKLFVNATKIVNPVFDSQTKETLKTPKSKFGKSLIDISDKFITNLSKTDIIEKIINQANFKDNQLLTKTDGAKKKKVKVDKLCDANKAGSNESKKCTLILTEGDSAKTMAISGLAEVGRDYYGVYPLRGKILNVRDASVTQIVNCAVLKDIKEILGLQSGAKYDLSTVEKEWPLRYGRVLLMTDQDQDGSHIKGLIMNVFDSMWQTLLKLGFICSMATPIVKAFKGSDIQIFYTLQDYEKWKEQVDINRWRIKYYKGLGTSSTQEAKEYFRNLKIITYEPEMASIPENDEEDVKSNSGGSGKDDDIKSFAIQVENRLDLAFNKKRADDRKSWLRGYDRNIYPDYSVPRLTFNKFVDEELIHFSNEDNDRSIPSIMDGLKPSQRKVLFACFKRNLKQEIKVSQLAGYVSENASYHHGEVSLEHCIKNMAQDFVGSNNINLLMPIGQMGTRLQGGADAAQSRYIFTCLNNITRSLYNKDDDQLCDYLNDDGFPIEPRYYYPILPMLAINGASGIGTGFSTEVPCHNPLDISKYIRSKIMDQSTDNLPINVWYRGFKGRIRPHNNGYITEGIFEWINDSTIRITELPVGKWTEDYIEFLEKATVERGKDDDKQFVKSYQDNSTESIVDITVKCDEDFLYRWRNKSNKDGVNELLSRLKLTTTLSVSNIHTFDDNCKIRKWSSIKQLVDYWYDCRKIIYVKRHQYLLDILRKDLEVISWKVKFILEIVENKLEIRNKKKADINNLLQERGYPKLLNDTYDYLLTMDLYKLTYEEVEELKKKRDTKQVEHDILMNKKPTDLWIEDLDGFDKVYNESLLEYDKEHSSNIPKTKKKKTTK
jgi:DNA topoisomerase-2